MSVYPTPSMNGKIYLSWETGLVHACPSSSGEDRSKKSGFSSTPCYSVGIPPSNQPPESMNH